MAAPRLDVTFLALTVWFGTAPVHAAVPHAAVPDAALPDDEPSASRGSGDDSPRAGESSPPSSESGDTSATPAEPPPEKPVRNDSTSETERPVYRPNRGELDGTLGVEEARGGDGVYGRFDGEFSVSAGLGVEIDTGAAAGRAAFTSALRFYQAIGLFVGGSQSVTESDPVPRSLRLGVLVEPLFLLRWSNDQEMGEARPDLILDSLALSFGAALLEPRGAGFGDRAAFDVGLGLGVPLFRTASGPWIRARGDGRFGQGDPTFIGSVFLEWQGFLESGLLDE